MPYDPFLAERLRKVLGGRKDLVEKMMFGGFCWMLSGNLLCGVEVGRFMFRVGPDHEQQALSGAAVKPMDITGRPMRGFVCVDARHATGSSLEDWVRLAESYVASLPPK